MITVNGIPVPYRAGMTVQDSIREAAADASLSVVLVEDKVVSDPRSYQLNDGDSVRILKIASGG